MKTQILSITLICATLSACVSQRTDVAHDSLLKPGYDVIELTPVTSRINYTRLVDESTIVSIEDATIIKAAEVANQKGFDAFYVLDADKAVEATESITNQAVTINKEIPPDLQCTMSGCDPVAAPHPMQQSSNYYSTNQDSELVHYSLVARFGFISELKMTETKYFIVDELLDDASIETIETIK